MPIWVYVIFPLMKKNQKHEINICHLYFSVIHGLIGHHMFSLCTFIENRHSIIILVSSRALVKWDAKYQPEWISGLLCILYCVHTWARIDCVNWLWALALVFMPLFAFCFTALLGMVAQKSKLIHVWFWWMCYFWTTGIHIFCTVNVYNHYMWHVPDMKRSVFSVNRVQVNTYMGNKA